MITGIDNSITVHFQNQEMRKKTNKILKQEIALGQEAIEILQNLEPTFPFHLTSLNNLHKTVKDLFEVVELTKKVPRPHAELNSLSRKLDLTIDFFSTNHKEMKILLYDSIDQNDSKKLVEGLNENMKKILQLFSMFPAEEVNDFLEKESLICDRIGWLALCITGLYAKAML